MSDLKYDTPLRTCSQSKDATQPYSPDSRSDEAAKTVPPLGDTSGFHRDEPRRDPDRRALNRMTAMGGSMPG
jgi:hypothetical protein